MFHTIPIPQPRRHIHILRRISYMQIIKIGIVGSIECACMSRLHLKDVVEACGFGLIGLPGTLRLRAVEDKGAVDGCAVAVLSPDPDL